MDHKRTTAYEKLQNYYKKFGFSNVGQKIKDSLIRLTQNYCDVTRRYREISLA